jgi:ribosomal protein L11 methyltransferase
MHILEVAATPESKDLVIAELYERGTEGVVENERPDGRIVLEAFFAEPFEDAAGEFGDTARWRMAEPHDWVADFEQGWPPIAVGERFWLVPHWREEDETPPGRLRLTVYPGLACGTGRHPTTQMCLRAMERVVEPGAAVLDIGAGSGILSAAAALLGAARIAGCDIDPDAVEIAAENLHKEGIAAGLWVGSLRSVRSESADVLVANINAEGVRGLAAEIRRVLKPGGAAIVSGFPRADRERALEGNALVVEREYEQEEWMAIVLRGRREETRSVGAIRRCGGSGRGSGQIEDCGARIPAPGRPL